MRWNGYREGFAAIGSTCCKGKAETEVDDDPKHSADSHGAVAGGVGLLRLRSAGAEARAGGKNAGGLLPAAQSAGREAGAHGVVRAQGAPGGDAVPPERGGQREGVLLRRDGGGWAGCALLVLIFLGVPLPLYLLAPVLGWVVVSGQVNGAWSKMRLALEKELPTFLLRMSATIQATPNVPEAVADVTASLDPTGPLQAWLKRLLVAMQTGGRKGLEEMREEAAAISPSLMLAVMELERLWETGGSGYVEAFRLASENLASILEGRAMAAAKADGAWGTIRIILLALGGSLVVAMSSSAGGGLFNTPTVQIGLLVALAWAALGWNVIGDMIREVME